MPEYELVREIFNRCSRNAMRDVSIDEIVTDDPIGYAKDAVKGADVRMEAQTLKDGTVVIETDNAGLRQRFSFTRI